MAKLTKHDKKSIEKRQSAVRYGTDVRLFLRISAAPVPAETERWNV